MSEQRIANDLYDLTETLVGLGNETTGGVLGGQFGYGAFFENDVFMMHPYCWCDRADCAWCRGCECAIEDLGDHLGWSERWHTVKECVNCATGVEPEREANFQHKASGSKVSWYKYIGRSMEVDLNADWRTLLAECEYSLAGAPADLATVRAVLRGGK